MARSARRVIELPRKLVGATLLMRPPPKYNRGKGTLSSYPQVSFCSAFSALLMPSYKPFKPSTHKASMVGRGNRAIDTKPELILRRTLWRLGLRYRVPQCRANIWGPMKECGLTTIRGIRERVHSTGHGNPRRLQAQRGVPRS